jgi:hypothetical protein
MKASEMDQQERQLRRVALIGAVVSLLVGGALIAAPALLSFAASAPRKPDRNGHIQPGSLPADRGAAAPLPTIARPPIALTMPPVSGTPTTISPAEAASAGEIPTADASPQPHNTRDTELAAYLVDHLRCLQPGAQYDPTLDLQASSLAHRQTTALPDAGVIQVHAQDGQYLLLGADTVADLRSQEGRCGETLIFGVPPLDWLPSGAHFGLGVDLRESGVVVAIVAS